MIRRRIRRCSWTHGACGATEIVFLFFAVPAVAQARQPPASTSQATAGDTSSVQESVQTEGSEGEQKKDAKQEKQQTTGTSNDRLFWTLPNFLTVENMEHVPPLTTREKFTVVTRTSLDLVEYPWYGFIAGVSQAENSEPGFGQGAKGYAKRFGTAFADGTIDNFMVGAVFPTVLHQDPRYYQLGKGGVWHRTGYALSRLIITRSDSGREQFNYSEIVGSAVTAGISNVYHPPGDRTVSNAVSVWWTQVGYDALAIVVKEFWPDIRRKLSKE